MPITNGGLIRRLVFYRAAVELSGGLLQPVVCRVLIMGACGNAPKDWLERCPRCLLIFVWVGVSG
jgi:hypothetical protein